MQKSTKKHGKITGADRGRTSSSWSGRPSAAGEAHTYTWLHHCTKHMTASRTWLQNFRKKIYLSSIYLCISLLIWIEIAIEKALKAFEKVKHNYFCMKSTLFEPWNVLIFMQTCRYVLFSNSKLTLMLPFNTGYRNWIFLGRTFLVCLVQSGLFLFA